MHQEERGNHSQYSNWTGLWVAGIGCGAFLGTHSCLAIIFLFFVSNMKILLRRRNTNKQSKNRAINFYFPIFILLMVFSTCLFSVSMCTQMRVSPFSYVCFFFFFFWLPLCLCFVCVQSLEAMNHHATHTQMLRDEVVKRTKQKLHTEMKKNHNFLFFIIIVFLSV